MISRRRPAALAVLSVLLAATSSVLAATPASAATTTYHRYVALGDSYASVGTLIFPQPGSPLECVRDTDNYPSDVAASVKPATFVDASCGGAVTGDMTTPQGSNPPQFNALTADTDLVTLSIGGNDAGFGEIITTCAQLSFGDPFGAPCQAHYTAGGTDELAARITALAPKIAAVLTGIKQRSPKAKIVVTGYLRILPPSGGCFPYVPISVGDVLYLNKVQHALNAMIGTQAANKGASFANPGDVLGHDVCQWPWDKWVEGLIPTSLSAPVHPNATGQHYVASLVAKSLTTSTS